MSTSRARGHEWDLGGRGGRLAYCSPVGVLVTIAPSRSTLTHPGRSLVRLHRAHRPFPFRRSLAPPLATATA